jgi:hypothetical protein
MGERRTAAWVLSIIALIAIFFTVILPEIRYKSTQTIAFKSCTVKFKYSIKGLEPDTYRANQNRLALCLCNLYKREPDTATANKIIKIYKDYDRYNEYDSMLVKANYNLDSIINHQNQVFDTLVLVD